MIKINAESNELEKKQKETHRKLARQNSCSLKINKEISKQSSQEKRIDGTNDQYKK